MIWRGEHPVRAIAAGLAVVTIAAALLGFAVGPGELTVVLLLAVGVALLVLRPAHTATRPADRAGARVAGVREG